jgi:peroxiredoxin
MQSGPARLALPCTLLAIGCALADGQDLTKPQEEGQPPGQVTAQVGQEAPDFTLLDCSGKKHELSDYKDRIVVLEWLNQQCPWSVKAVPVMKDLRKKYEGKGIVWLGVDSTHWRKPEENVQYIKDKGLDFPILMDNDGRVGRMYGAKTTPHVYVINKGRLVYRGALHDDQHGQKKDSEVRNYLDQAIQAVLDGKDVPVAETTSWGCSVKYKEPPVGQPVENKKEN